MRTVKSKKGSNLREPCERRLLMIIVFYLLMYLALKSEVCCYKTFFRQYKKIQGNVK